MPTEKLGAARRITISCTVIVHSGARIDFGRISTIFLHRTEADNSALNMVHTPRNQLGLVEL
jgi:hypothetical protein